MRCGTLALGVLIYVLTALVLELYWMRNATDHRTIASVPPGFSSMPHLAKVEQPPPPSPPALVTATTKEGEGRRGGKSLPAAQRVDPVPPLPPTMLQPPLADTVASSKVETAVEVKSSEATPRATRARGECWKLPQPFFSAPFDRAMASVVHTRPDEKDAEWKTPGPLQDIAQVRSYLHPSHIE